MQVIIMAERARYGGGSIREHKATGGYVVSFKGRSTTCKNKKDAEAKLRQFKCEAKLTSDDERKQAMASKKKGTQTVVQVIEQFRAVKYKRSQPKVRTVQRENETLELIKRTAIADIAVKDLTADMIWDNFIVVLQSTHSQSSAKKAFELLKATLRWASSKKQGIVPYNECDEITFPAAETFVYNQKTSHKVKFYTLEQQQAILNICDEKRKNGEPVSLYGPLIKLLLFTGLREGEACYLKWDHIDLINKTLTVEGTVVEDTIVNDKTKEKTNIVIAQDTTKTKDGRRTIPLSDDAYDALWELRNRFGSEGYVVKTEDGAMYRPSYVRKKMAAIVKKISKTDPTILDVQSKVHALRHTFATNEILKYMQGTGQSKENAIQWVSHVLGHSTIEITNSTYNHMLTAYIRNSRIKTA